MTTAAVEEKGSWMVRYEPAKKVAFYKGYEPYTAKALQNCIPLSCIPNEAFSSMAAINAKLLNVGNNPQGLMSPYQEHLR